MADIITTLHANKRPDLILFPQLKADNIPVEAMNLQIILQHYLST